MKRVAESFTTRRRVSFSFCPTTLMLNLAEMTPLIFWQRSQEPPCLVNLTLISRPF